MQTSNSWLCRTELKWRVQKRIALNQEDLFSCSAFPTLAAGGAIPIQSPEWCDVFSTYLFIACARHPATFPSSTSFRDAVGLVFAICQSDKVRPELCFMKAASFPTDRLDFPSQRFPCRCHLQNVHHLQHRTLGNLNDWVWWSAIKYYLKQLPEISSCNRCKVWYLFSCSFFRPNASSAGLSVLKWAKSTWCCRSSQASV